MKTKTAKTTKNINKEIVESYQNPLAWWGDVQEKCSITARWMALYEAVNLIADKAEEKNIPLEKVEFKPLDIRDYMAATEDVFLRKLLEEDYGINICHNEDAPKEMKEIFPEVDVEITY